MKILWLNWRDIKNPAAGGAEVFTHEVIRRLVDKGCEITLFASHFLGALDEESIDGAKVVRGGGKYSVYQKAKNYYLRHKDQFDLVIDEINTKPFLSPQYVEPSKPIVALIHQLAREGLFYELSFPLNYLTYHVLEKKWLSTYKDKPNVTIVTVSRSTKEDLQNFVGLNEIFVVPEGLSVSPLADRSPKEPVPTLAFVGRLKRYKLPDHALQAFVLIKEQIPEAKMWVIGEGYLRERLESKYASSKDIVFYGRAGDRLKYELMSRAHLLLVPSVKEGWGLVVTESNAMGTPAIAYDVSGLRDSVVHGSTGIIVKENNPRALADSAISLLKNEEKLVDLSKNALEFAKTFSWDKTAEEIFSVLQRATSASFRGRLQDAGAA